MMYENIDFNSIDLTQEPPVSEPERQYYFIAKCRQYVKEQEELAGHPLTADVVTFGCQMNARDSEKLSGILEQVGYTLSDSEEADFVIYNTCTVRDNANHAACLKAAAWSSTSGRIPIRSWKTSR